ncbi:MAG: DUF1844 domain-containing protein [Acidobacteriota bacterium]|jgi:hypothetical protein
MDDDKLFDDNEEKPKIKVTDRRKFTMDGDLRPSATDARDAERGGEASPSAAPSEEPSPTPHSEPAAEADPSSAPAEESAVSSESPESPPSAAETAGAAAAGDAGGPSGPAPSIADLPRDFTAFVEGMYLEAMLYLGALPDPRTGDTAEDLDMAKYKIDLLGMIQEKTRDNLTDDEAQQLEDVLYQLRMFFVQRGQGGAK